MAYGVAVAQLRRESGLSFDWRLQRQHVELSLGKNTEFRTDPEGMLSVWEW